MNQDSADPALGSLPVEVLRTRIREAEDALQLLTRQTGTVLQGHIRPDGRLHPDVQEKLAALDESRRGWRAILSDLNAELKRRDR